MSCALAPPRPNPLPGTLADWRRTLGAHYLRLGRASRQRRFMAILPDRSMRLIANRATPDIVLGIEADDRVVGVLELFRGIDGHAEIGISVEDAYQGRGFGKALFIAGLAAADRMGIRTADLTFATENRGIRRLVSEAGGQVIQRGPECEAHIDISLCKACKEATADLQDRVTQQHNPTTGSLLPKTGTAAQGGR